jgi:hypothetical protein
MKKLLFLFLFLPFCSQAQVPEPHMLSLKGIGGSGSDQIGRDVTKTQDGKFILRYEVSSLPNTGNIDSFCSVVQKRLIFVEYNEDGTPTDWSKCYGFHGDSFLLHIFPRPDKSVVLGGLFNSTAGWGWLITKQDAAGNTIWQRNYSKGFGSLLNAMMPTSDGGYIMMGESHRTDTNVLTHYGSWSTFDIWLLKVDSNGYKVWSRVIGGTEHESGAALVPGPDNGFYVVGGTGSYDYDCTGNPGGGSAYLVRLNDTGGIIWHRCLGGSSHDAATAACSNGSGGVIMAVNTSSSDHDVVNYHGGGDYWVVEVDTTGSIVWSNCYGTANTEVPLAICKASDGSVWINGINYENYDDVYLVHTDSIGNLLHEKVMASSGKDRGTTIHALKDNLVFMAGYYRINNLSFSSLNYLGATDVFHTVFAPWTANITDPKKNKFSVYPNPTQNTLHISSSMRLSSHLVTIRDTQGRTIKSINIKSNTFETTIDVGELENGNYLIKISDNNNLVFSEIFAISK